MPHSCKDTHNIIAIIITYNPDETLLKNNIKILLPQVNNILIVNNSTSIESGSYGTAKIINNNDNLGIATALNAGINFALDNNFKYALFLDQDSTPDEDLVEHLKAAFMLDDAIAMAVPQIQYLGTNKKTSTLSEYQFINFAITSGSLLDLSLISKLGYFDDELFIDSVDFEYCFKIRLNKFKIARINKAILYQRLGNMVQHKLMGMEFYPTNHNYIRRYYIVRNRLYIAKKYYHFDKKYLYKSIKRMIYEFTLVILFEDDKIRKTRSVIRALIDFTKGKTGKYDY